MVPLCFGGTYRKELGLLFCRFFKRKHLKPCLSLNCALRSLSLQRKDLEEGKLGLLNAPCVKEFSIARKRNILLKCFQCSGRAVPLQLRVPQPHLLPLIWLRVGGIPAKASALLVLVRSHWGDRPPAAPLGYLHQVYSPLLGGEAGNWSLRGKNLPWDHLRFNSGARAAVGNTGDSDEILHYEAKQERTFFPHRSLKMSDSFNFALSRKDREMK